MSHVTFDRSIMMSRKHEVLLEAVGKGKGLVKPHVTINKPGKLSSELVKGISSSSTYKSNIVRRLFGEELDDRKKRGLCFNSDELM